MATAREHFEEAQRLLDGAEFAAASAHFLASIAAYYVDDAGLGMPEPGANDPLANQDTPEADVVPFRARRTPDGGTIR